MNMRIQFSFIASILVLLVGISGCGYQTLGLREKDNSEDPPEVRLGERLFLDVRFSSPNTSKRFSCRTCHLVDEDKRGIRAYADFDDRSRIPQRPGDGYMMELRNSPTLLDTREMTRLHFDGEFPSLENLVKTTMSTRNMGWLAGEQNKAFDNALAVLLNDQAEGENAEGTYQEQFKKTYGVEIASLTRDQAVDWIGRSMSDYMRDLHSSRTSPYDIFVKINGLETGPAKGEDAKAYSRRHLEKINSLQVAGKLKFPGGFNRRELEGLKIFFRVEGENRVGNCAVCHTPPLFTDNSFHNTGVTQAEYDTIHGLGAFAELEIPNASQAKRPSADLRTTPIGDSAAYADLGHWNFVDLKNSPLRHEGESDDALLTRMIGAFKTPTLRNLRFTNPYLHNGRANEVADAVRADVTASRLAQKGQLRSGDSEMSGMKIEEGDVAPLAAFLNALNEDYE